MNKFLIAVPLALGLFATHITTADAWWRGGGAYGYRGYGGYGYHGGYGGYGYGYRGGYGGYGYRGYGPGVVAGTVLGLGLGSVLPAPYYAPRPYYYAPPPVVYTPPPPYYYYPQY